MFGDRRSAAAFWFGSLIITIGVGLHLPMKFLMARDMGYSAGIWHARWIPAACLVGMALIVLGIVVAGYGAGFLPKTIGSLHHEVDGLPPSRRLKTRRLTRAHWRLDAGPQRRPDHRHRRSRPDAWGL